MFFVSKLKIIPVFFLILSLIFIAILAVNLGQKKEATKKFIIVGFMTNQFVVILVFLAFLLKEPSLIDLSFIYVLLSFSVVITMFMLAKNSPNFLFKAKKTKQKMT